MAAAALHPLGDEGVGGAVELRQAVMRLRPDQAHPVGQDLGVVGHGVVVAGDQHWGGFRLDHIKSLAAQAA